MGLFEPLNLDCVSSPSLQKIPFMAAPSLLTFCQLFFFIYFVAAHLSRGTPSDSPSASKAYNFLCLLPSVILGSSSSSAEFQGVTEPWACAVWAQSRIHQRKHNSGFTLIKQLEESSFFFILCSIYCHWSPGVFHSPALLGRAWCVLPAHIKMELHLILFVRLLGWDHFPRVQGVSDLKEPNLLPGASLSAINTSNSSQEIFGSGEKTPWK